ncbi:MAG: protein kinase, partial [Polyangia bacterium]|nr:protein kinase [Polyangia bacterium]
EVDLRIRFLDEARILARLDHPNIVMLHNFKQDRGRMLILMQYVDGEGLDLILSREGPMHPERASLIFAPLCDALHHAHEHGIIHRDLKPSNILVDRGGKARITDFGIAKLNEGGAHLTRTGTRVGTSWFMSPEQGLNRPADPRSDIYALGVTLYNSLAGRLPFYGESEYEVIKGHVELAPPPIYQTDHPLAVEVEAIVMRALAKRPEDRYQSGMEMRDALLDALASHGETEVRGGGGTGIFAIHKGASPLAKAPLGAQQLEGTPPPAPLAETRVDPVIPVPTPELRPVTPSIGKRPEAGVGTAQRPITQPMPTVVPQAVVMPERAPSPVGEEPSPARLRTPSGRPAAPGKMSQSTGLLLESSDQGVGVVAVAVDFSPASALGAQSPGIATPEGPATAEAQPASNPSGVPDSPGDQGGTIEPEGGHDARDLDETPGSEDPV